MSLPPVLSIDVRQYPVSIHFEKRTPENYLTAAFHKICEIHEHKSPGTILVFLSGKLEVSLPIFQMKFIILRTIFISSINQFMISLFIVGYGPLKMACGTLYD